MKDTAFAPIALFVYNRPKHTAQTIAALAANEGADQSDLYIFSDAPKSSADVLKTRAVRELIRDVSGFQSVTVIEREQNMGLANSIIAGVSQLTTQYGRVIVFEDDLVSSPYTLLYFNAALERYALDAKVMHIGAYMYPIDPKLLPESFFFRAVTSWGWATWERAWKQFEPDVNFLLAQFDAEKISAFSIEGKMNFWKQLLDFKAGKNNSWAIRWYASVFLAGGTSLHPGQSLIQNIGHDGSGVHSNKESIYDIALRNSPILDFPSEIAENPSVYACLKAYYQGRKGTLLQRIKRLIVNRLTF